mmetsp:Transcript_52417/g.95730  ORF Transcript_52417/g.95730 Transcript_52417/m.95730 type:complete len:1267 (-) Transcript_52417:51-3851(-)
MVPFSISFFCIGLGTRLMLVVASPCTGDDHLLGDVCNEIEEASSFLQVSKKPTGSGVEQRPEISQTEKQLMDRVAQELAEENKRKAQAKDIKIEKLAEADNVSIDEARILYSADVAARREQRKLIDIEKLSDMDSISIDEAKEIYAEDKKAEMQQRKEIKIEDLAEKENVTFEKAKQILHRVEETQKAARNPSENLTSGKLLHEAEVLAHEAAKDSNASSPLTIRKEEGKPMHQADISKHEAAQKGGESSLPSNMKAAPKPMLEANAAIREAVEDFFESSLPSDIKPIPKPLPDTKVANPSLPSSQEYRMTPEGSAVTYNELFERLSDEDFTPDQIRGRWQSLRPVSKDEASQGTGESSLLKEMKPASEPMPQEHRLSPELGSAVTFNELFERLSDEGLTTDQIQSRWQSLRPMSEDEAAQAVGEKSLLSDIEPKPQERRVLPESGSAVTYNELFERLSDEDFTPDQVKARWDSLKPAPPQAAELPGSFLKEEVNRSEAEDKDEEVEEADDIVKAIESIEAELNATGSFKEVNEQPNMRPLGGGRDGKKMYKKLKEKFDKLKGLGKVSCEELAGDWKSNGKAFSLTMKDCEGKGFKGNKELFSYISMRSKIMTETGTTGVIVGQPGSYTIEWVGQKNWAQKPSGPVLKPLGKGPPGPLLRPLGKGPPGPVLRPLMKPLGGSGGGVAPFNCVKYGKPIQCLKAGKRGFGFYELNVETGKYLPIYEVPFSRTQPPYEDLNACGINPVDDKMYCAMKAKEMYIARMDSTTAKFVAKVPGSGKPYTSGTFGPDGTLFIADDQARFLVIKDVDKMSGFDSKKDKALPDLTKLQLKKPTGFHSAADVVVVNADLEKAGKKDYVIVLNRGSLMVAQYENNKFGKTWIMPYKAGNKKGKWKEKWGAGWLFGGKVFFASNEGKGVYEIDMKALDLTKDTKGLSPFALTKMGKASPSAFNDGANCLNAPDPWKTKIVPWNCKIHPQPAQILRGNSGYDVKKLNLVSGKYDLVYSIPFSRTKPAFKYLNAVGLSPIDNVPYGCLLFGDFPAAAFIVRIDHEKFEFLAKIKGKFDPIAGTFDSDGNYFFVHNTKDSSDPVMYSMSGLDGMQGYTSHKDPKLPVIKQMKGLTLGEFYQFADIVAVNFDFEVSGTKSDYILGINDRKQVVVVKWNDDSPEDSNLWRFSTTDVLTNRKAFRNFGAAWNYNGRVFMAANDGVGLFETKKLDFSKRLITLEKVGDSAPIVNTDGFNCWNIDAPFPATKGRVSSAFIQPQVVGK